MQQQWADESLDSKDYSIQFYYHSLFAPHRSIIRKLPGH